MIKFPWKIEKRPVSPAELKLKEISEILFPPYETKEDYDDNGSLIKFHVDYSVDSNIDAALSDLYDGYNDSAVQSTLKDVAERLNKVRLLLEAYPIIDTNVKYIIVNTKKAEDVEAADD